MSETTENVNLIDDDSFWKDMGVADKSDAPIKSEENQSKSASETTQATSTPIASDNTVIAHKLFTPNDTPSIAGDISVPPQYQRILDSVLYGYSVMPKLDYNALYHEIGTVLTLKSQPTPDPQSISQQLDKIQGATERLEEILSDVIQCYNYKKSMVDLLSDMWAKYSTAKSADLRRSEVANLLANFIIDLSYVENLKRVCDVKISTLKGQFDTVSRKISNMQICLKHFDLGRGMFPDYTFKTFSGGVNVVENENKKPVDPTLSIDALEQDFPIYR